MDVPGPLRVRKGGGGDEGVREDEGVRRDMGKEREDGRGGRRLGV